MAEKKKANSKSSATVTRIKASDSSASAPAKPAKKKQASVATAPAVAAPTKKKRPIRIKGAGRPFVAIKNYFAGAWYELRQVRWPNRRATWGMTFAVIAYSAFFVVLVILLDIAFKYLFDVILGK